MAHESFVNTVDLLDQEYMLIGNYFQKVVDFIAIHVLQNQEMVVCTCNL